MHLQSLAVSNACHSRVGSYCLGFPSPMKQRKGMILYATGLNKEAKVSVTTVTGMDNNGVSFANVNMHMLPLQNCSSCQFYNIGSCYNLFILEQFTRNRTRTSMHLAGVILFQNLCLSLADKFIIMKKIS